MARDSFGVVGQRRDRGVGREIEEILLNCCHLVGGRVVHGPLTLLSQHDPAAAAIVRAVLAAAEAALFRPGDVLRQPATRPGYPAERSRSCHGLNVLGRSRITVVPGTRTEEALEPLTAPAFSA